MRIIIVLLLVFSFVTVLDLCVAAGEMQIGIPRKGETVVVAKSKDMDVRITITTSEVHTGEPCDEKLPVSICSDWGYLPHPHSVVSKIVISVNGNMLDIPNSMLWGLNNLSTAEIKLIDKEAILTLGCGDGAESYDMKINFDKERIKRKSFIDGLDPDNTIEETIYYIPKTD